MTTIEILQKAKRAAPSLAMLDTDTKNKALLAMADSITEEKESILEANRLDVESAQKKMNDVMIDRLCLTEQRIMAMSEGIKQVAALPDPVFEIMESHARPNGLIINKVRVPMGVVAIIYESRPNVTSDAAALSLKSGNVCVLRGGKEAYRSSRAIVDAMKRGLEKNGLNPDFVNMVDDTTRQSANQLMTAVGYVDLLIPRGGAGLIRTCVENAKVPCIQTGTGICHLYVDGEADQDMALNILENGKTSRPSVCNALEVCLVSRSIAKDLLPKIKKRLVDDRIALGKTPVELRLDSEALTITEGISASDEDFDAEFLNYILAIKLVDDVVEAVEHISHHSTHHSEAIVTSNKKTAEYFTMAVDSAAVYVNASTRFTDGGEFGHGCEIGISTQKLHARGPMALREMTTYKYIIEGNGQVR